MHKECIKCGEKKDISNFYGHPGMKDKHLSECKECTKKRCRISNGIHKRICRECGNNFNTTGGELKRGGGNYCSRECARKCNRGKDNNKWEGDDVGKGAVHAWIGRTLGKPKYCEHCKQTNKKVYDWANKDHTYRRNIKEYMRLCRSCHRKYDIKNRIAKRHTCGECNRAFYTKNIRKKYCSRRCAKRHRRKGTHTTF